ncbi:DUF3015 family protein [Peredibacter sp. HCB2-198]|uniref:DUF3015 family protein n=1 Tax=Peredibacter sp. HCB2-198 TaxID=3383025 RepID=UPI0038B60586
MKRLLVIGIALCVSMSAVAQTKKAQTTKKNKGLIGSAVDKADAGYYGMAGCGLGSVLFGESESRGGQILAATTNSTYGNNTFGMSSGTSNCVQEKSATSAEVKKNMDKFIAANREALANDIAKSNGETIVTMSNIMGCKDSAYLGSKLQSRYESIFDSKEDIKVSDNMYNTVTSDRYLVENCKL